MGIYKTNKKCPSCGGKISVQTSEEGSKIYHCEKCDWKKLNRIAVIKDNLEILRKAKRECNCGAVCQLHYHELIWEDDGESGNEYIAETEEECQSFVEELERELQKLQGRKRNLVK